MSLSSLWETEDASRVKNAWRPLHTGGSLHTEDPTEASVWKCTHRVCQLTPSNSGKIILVQLLSFCICVVAYFPNCQWWAQLPESNTNMRSNKSAMPGKKPDDWGTFKRWRGKTCTSWELTPLQHHKFGEKRTNIHPKQCCHPHQGV